MTPSRSRLILVLIFGLMTLPLDAQERSLSQLFRPLPAEETGIYHRNDIIESDSFYMSVFIYAYNGAGVGIGDVNGDDLPDIYLLGTQTHAPSRLYLNRGNLRFEDASKESGLLDSAGIRFGVTMVDIDGDGDLDIYVTRQKDPNRLYINDGKGHFVDRAGEFGLDFCCSSMHGSFLDYDRDGDLDLYLGINGQAFERNPMVLGLPDRFFRNDGGHFTEVTAETGIADEAYAQSVTVGDIDGDGWIDIYVSNDFQEKDDIYLNNRNGTFREVMVERFNHTSASSMGSEIADVNNDGLLDIVTLDMLPDGHFRKMANVSSLSTFSPVFDSTQAVRNTLQINRGNGYFSDVGQMAGISATDWSWAPLLIDADHDRDRDLFITNGFKRDVQNLDVTQYFNPHESKLALVKRVPPIWVANYFYRNDGDFRFSKVSREWGVDQVINSNGAAWGDLDNDGDLDLVINNLDTVAMVLENRAETLERQWIQFRLIGREMNRTPIGARVTVYDRLGSQTAELITARGYLSSSEPIIHFGLGDVDALDSVRIEWPDGSWSIHPEFKAGQRYTIRQSESRVHTGPTPREQAFAELQHLRTPFTRDTDRLDHVHIENYYLDFHLQRLIPRRFSINGPAIAVGDINGDGTEDLWIGGAKRESGMLYTQNSDGMFLPLPSPALANDSLFEDQGGLLIDLDGDGDRDLVVTSGGIENHKSPELNLLRVYLNDGRGAFARDREMVPESSLNLLSISAADIDNDGDNDLFVGGRLVPGAYPDPPESMLLINEDGRFIDGTEGRGPDLKRIGMISSSLFTDYDNDGDPDLFLVGEWMTPTLFENRSGRFVNVTDQAGLDGYEGWWNSIAGGDLDNDGDIDYILGNLGLNTKAEIRADSNQPLRIYSGDFDGNGSIDLVTSYYYNGIEYPNRTKADVAEQMKTYLNRKFPSPSRYAMSTLHMIYDSTLLANAKQLRATTFASMYAENRGDGTFTLRPLPTAAQVAPIHGIVVEDVDGDGELDVVVADNFHGPDGSAIQYDAGFGLFLRGNGRGALTPVEPFISGLQCRCDARSLVTVRMEGGNGLYLIAGCNAATTELFRFADRSIVVPLSRLNNGTEATSATIRFEDGKTRRLEWYNGSGYLSTQSRSLVLPLGKGSVETTLYRGTESVWSGEIETGR